MKRLLNKLQLPDWIALGLLLLYVTAFSWMTIRQHNGFRTNALDLGKFDQMIWNAAQGRRPYSTITQQSAVQGHFSPALALYAPLYWVWEDIRLLFILQSICLGGAGFLIYWFFRDEAPWLGLAVYVAYALHPSVHQVNLVEFRRVTAAVLAASFSIYQMLKRRYAWMVLGLVLGLLCKEDMAFLAAGLGLYLSLARQSTRVGLPLMVLGLAWVILVPLAAVPAFGGTYRAAGKYLSYLGDSPKEMVYTVLRDPTVLLEYAARPERWKAVVRLCWPTGFLFFLAPEIAALVLPFLGYLLVSTSTTMGRLQAWYPSPILPILFWAVGLGASRLRGRPRTGALAILLVASAAGYATLSELRPQHWPHLERFRVTRHHQQVAAALQQIPVSATVAAQDPLVPHLSHREQIYLFPWFPDETAPEYVVLDRGMKTYPVETPSYRTLFHNVLAGTEYDIEHQVGSLYIFRYAGRVLPESRSGQEWDKRLTLTGYSIAVAPPGEAFGPMSYTVPAGSTMRVSLFWRVEGSIDRNYTVFVHALSHDGQLLAQHDSWPADAHRPTSVLPPGTVVRDVHYLTVPQAISGEVVARVGLYDEQGTHLTTQEGQEFVDLSLGG
ncbi:MAG: DUF2079 domain-containing protein [Anaerolineae bacterium]